MIVDLPGTTTAQISQRIDAMHEERGEAAQGRVLTLLIATTDNRLEEALEIANGASREHPCRVIAVVPHEDSDEGHLDAQLRFGADAGAGECIVLYPTGALTHHLDTLVIPLLVPDAPVMAWWLGEVPENPSLEPLGAIARSRITDATHSADPAAAFAALRANWNERDTDLSWTRLTIWRALLVSMLDQPPYTAIREVTVQGSHGSLPVDLLASWLALKLKVPVTIDRNAEGGLIGVIFHREDGDLSIRRTGPFDEQAVIEQPGQMDQHLSMPKRSLEECLSEEMRRLEPDVVYGEVLAEGWNLVNHD